MFENYAEAIKKFGTQGEGKWWVNGEDLPLKCAIVGSFKTGCARFVRGQGSVAATKDEGGKLRFAVNVFDGEKCRILEGSQALYTKLKKLHDGTAGLDQVWVEIGKDEKQFYYAKYAGDLSDRDKSAITSSDQECIEERCRWLDDEAPY